MPAGALRVRRPERLDIGVYGARGIPSTYSGYETFLTVLLPRLVARGHRVTMYCRQPCSCGLAEFQGVRRALLPAIRSKQLETLSHGALASVVSRLRGHDVVLAVNLANAPFCLMARATRQRTVLNTDGQEWRRGKWSALGRGYFRLCGRIAGHAACALVSDCEAIRAIYRQEFKVDTTVIPYCWPGLRPEEDLSALDRHGVQPYRYFLVAARLNPENNVSAIARAHVNSGVRYPLLVLGEANYASPVAAELQSLALRSARVKLAGHVTDRSAFATLAKHAAAYVHGHSVGGLNPSLVEAMGCGANVIALRTAFNEEALGEAGRYWQDTDAELPGLLQDTERATIPQDEGRRLDAGRRARRLFDVDDVTDAYEELLCEVAGRGAWRTTRIATRWAPGQDRANPCTVDPEV